MSKECLLSEVNEYLKDKVFKSADNMEVTFTDGTVISFGGDDDHEWLDTLTLSDGTEINVADGDAGLMHEWLRHPVPDNFVSYFDKPKE